MPRSYLYIKENDFQIYHNPAILSADALIIDIYDASCIFANYNKLYNLLEQIKEKKIKLYLRLDCKEYSRCSKALNLTYGSLIAGFFIEDPTPKNLQRFNLRIREYELNQKLPFESLKFVAVINKAKHVNRLKHIMSSSRVEDIILQDINKVNMDYVNDLVNRLSTEYNKVRIDLRQITTNISDITDINQKYLPQKEDIQAAIDFLNKVRFARRKEKEELLAKNSLRKTYRLLEEAQKLDLVTNFPIVYYKQIKKKEKILKKPLVIKKFYTVGEEIANAITHGIGAGLAIAGLVLLMVKGGSTVAILSYLVFTISALILYLSSTLYHSLALGNLAKLLFNKIDHMTIYLLIAGTYTPFSLLVIGGSLGTMVCIILWSGALLGMLLNLFAFGKFRLFHMILYVFLGWIAIFFLPEIINNMAKGGLILLITGGVMYTVGIFFYSLKLFKFSHTVWHIFTILGTLLHFFSLLYFV